MNPFSIYARLAVYGAIALAVAFSYWYVYVQGKKHEINKQIVAAAKQSKDNAERARFVEVQYVDREVLRTKIITKIEKELPNATKNLAACTITDDAVRLLNDAARAVK